MDLDAAGGGFVASSDILGVVVVELEIFRS